MRYLNRCRSASYAVMAVGLVLAVADSLPAATELVLHTHFVFTGQPAQLVAGRTPRELGRQALLMAAREEIGMRTCDMTLREAPITDDPLVLLATVEAVSGRKFKVRVFELGAQEPFAKSPPVGEAVLEFAFDLPDNMLEIYPHASKLLEEASRGKLVQFLREQGATAAAADPEGLEDPGLDIDDLLSRVDIVSQFVALRELHRRYREDQSAEMLQGLVRGYANLGLLNETNWGASSVALQARALLYCARLEALHGEHPLTPWTLAYADALVGLHCRALERLRALENDPAQGDLPGWTGLIGPYCRFDTEGLETLSEDWGPHRRWAAYLRAWAVYNSRELDQLVTVGRESQQACPEAMNLCFLLTESQPIGIMRYANSVELRGLLRNIPKRLASTPSIPEDVVAVAKAPDRKKPPGVYWRNIMQSLRQAEPAGEPSWGMLASLLGEQSMRAAWNSMYVNRAASTEIDLSPLAEYWRPFVEDHPDRAFIPTASLLRSADTAAMQAACGDLRFRDPNRWMFRAWGQDTLNLKNGAGELIGKQASAAATKEYTCQTLSRHLDYKNTTGDFAATVISQLSELAPYSPVPLIKSIERARRMAQPLRVEQLDAWREEAGGALTPGESWAGRTRGPSNNRPPSTAMRSRSACTRGTKRFPSWRTRMSSSG